MIRTAVRARRAALATVGSMVLLAGLSACSSMGSNDDGGEGDGPPGAEGRPTGLRTTATMGKVTGKLERDRRASLRQKVTATFDCLGRRGISLAAAPTRSRRSARTRPPWQRTTGR